MSTILDLAGLAAIGFLVAYSAIGMAGGWQ